MLYSRVAGNVSIGADLLKELCMPAVQNPLPRMEQKTLEALRLCDGLQGREPPAWLYQKACIGMTVEAPTSVTLGIPKEKFIFGEELFRGKAQEEKLDRRDSNEELFGFALFLVKDAVVADEIYSLGRRYAALRAAVNGLIDTAQGAPVPYRARCHHRIMETIEQSVDAESRPHLLTPMVFAERYFQGIPEKLFSISTLVSEGTSVATLTEYEHYLTACSDRFRHGFRDDLRRLGSELKRFYWFGQDDYFITTLASVVEQFVSVESFAESAPNVGDLSTVRQLREEIGLLAERIGDFLGAQPVFEPGYNLIPELGYRPIEPLEWLQGAFSMHATTLDEVVRTRKVAA